MSDTAPITAVSSAPPIMDITSNDEPSLRASSCMPSRPSAKMVGNITDMNTLAATSAYNPVQPGNAMATAHNSRLIVAKLASNLAGAR